MWVCLDDILRRSFSEQFQQVLYLKKGSYTDVYINKCVIVAVPLKYFILCEQFYRCGTVAVVQRYRLSELLLICFYPNRCVPEAAAGCSNECDLLVPGEQRGDSPPTTPGNDLCWPGWLRAHATGESTLHTKFFTDSSFNKPEQIFVDYYVVR